MAQNSLDNLPEAQEQENKFEDVDFDEVGEKLGAELGDGGKPTLSSNTNAVVVGVELKRNTVPKKDKNGKEFYETILTVHTELEDGRESFDNYGGLREYSDGYWNGQKSAFGRLQKLMQDEFKVKSRKDMLRELPGAKVKIKTETSTFQGQEYPKNMIQSFR